MRTSIRSFVIGLVGLGATAVVRTLVVLGVGGENGHTIVSDVGAAGILLSVAAVILVIGFRLPREELRRSWILLGIGVLCFALGDTAWAIIEIGKLGTPYPGIPDVFYLLNYVFVGVAVFLPAFALRHREDVLGGLLIAAITSAVGVAALFFGLVEPMMSRADLEPLERALNILYPLADVCLLLSPAVFVLVLGLRSGDRRQMLPWLYVSAGLALMAITDTAFSWMAATDTYVGGAIVDYGWMVAGVSLAVAASLALDATTEPKRYAVEVVSSDTVPAGAYSLPGQHEVDAS